MNFPIDYQLTSSSYVLSHPISLSSIKLIELDLYWDSLRFYIFIYLFISLVLKV